ncbi:hypothetical protein ACFVGY_21490 [Streptomyces sp. NPDC127106]|uniref:hypothetical protein n=1 Tax=Streptomyces sp. NPDC127106 TaxID=3345360 RepID=UPI00363BC8CD
MTAARICARCQRPIIDTRFETITVHSSSGARPDQHAHRRGDPACRPIRASER